VTGRDDKRATRIPSRLPTRAPFHLEATARVLQRRPSNLVDVWERDRYLRVLEIAERLILVEVRNGGTVDAPDVRYCLRSGDASVAVSTSLRRILGLDVDPKPLQDFAQIDGLLRSTVLALRGMRPPRFANLFESFVNVIPFQQLSLDAGVAIVGRLIRRFGRQLEYAGHQYYASPAAHRIADARLDALRACGLSSKKAQTLRDLARMIDTETLKEKEISLMPTPQALSALTQLPGIGPWSAALVLLRGLGRLDVFPPGDTGAARGLGALLQLRRHASLDRAVERFGNHRGYLYFCGLGASLLSKGIIHAAPANQASRAAPH
jgi:3-methyladenine DNA glycosylase/8-oxoguanine DNA glycosylase